MECEELPYKIENDPFPCIYRRIPHNEKLNSHIQATTHYVYTSTATTH